MFAVRVELCPNRDLIDNDFDGYKLALDPLPTYSHAITDVDEVGLGEELYSFQHVKSCSLHNHLHQDPWNRDHVYYVSTDWTIKLFSVNAQDFRLAPPISVFKIPRRAQQRCKRQGIFNVSLQFASANRVTLADGAGTLYLLNTGDRSVISTDSTTWHVCFTSDECATSKPFVLLDAVSHVSSSSTEDVDCLLLHIEEKKLAGTGDDVSNPFATVLEWVTLSSSASLNSPDELSTWKLGRTRRIIGSSSIDYAALETNGKSLCTISENPFTFSYDSKAPLNTAADETQPDDSAAATANRPKEGTSEAPTYAWTQNANDLSVWFLFAESVKKDDVVFRLTSSHLFLGLRDGSVLLQGLLYATIDMEGSTWTLIDNRLEVTLNKADTGLMWRELVKGDNRGEEILDEKLIQEIHERLAHLTSDQMNPDPQGNRAGSFNPQQLEECDTFPVDSYLLVRLDGETHRATHKVSLSSHQWLFSANRTAAEMPALCIRHDVDGLLWQPSTLQETISETTTDPWTLNHVATFNALGYVLASKQQKKFLGCSSADAFVAVADVRRHLYLYYRPESLELNGSELRNRRTGAIVQATAKQRVISLDNSDVIGLSVSDSNVFVLTKESLARGFQLHFSANKWCDLKSDQGRFAKVVGMQDENAAIQADEVEAMSAIYGKDWTTVSEAARTYNVILNRHDKPRQLNLQVTLPWQYPTDAPPLYQLNAPWMRSAEKLELVEALEEIYCNHVGESILYLWVEKVREFLHVRNETSKENNDDDDEDLLMVNVALEREFLAMSDELPEIVHGEAVTHKKSTFQAHLASIVSVDQVPRLLGKLKEDRKIANATHNMYAYRILNAAKGTSLQDCDDDGEDHAGSRLLHLLQILEAHNVLVIVSRWYGGIQLGPDRFRYINNCARDILLVRGHIKGAAGSNKKS